MVAVKECKVQNRLKREWNTMIVIVTRAVDTRNNMARAWSQGLPTDYNVKLLCYGG